ncbi:FabD/lysophospholipase-like protein [Schizophyllum commune H4-8]|uniref:PNPLA domain-containing protein n=1 Tax=Schizophyllum commune (strain H4-8 / FGSC 9210) TaxID=578458 RepID=D8PUT6_SCHCM|nr:FabD/lysophospholipase-like protein [Schizophyllum commune H4-8]KAI5900624.1 FabD/lysophospholipase-like protein [Schizophyllum commune H4-8]
MAARAVSQTSSFGSNSKPSRSSVPQDVVYASPSEIGLRLLTFDDGGIRGLSMLLLLRIILHRVQRLSCLPALPLPCDYFDFIAGSGTGGLIAILLGRLQLSVDHAIECYLRVVNHVFVQYKQDGSLKTTALEKVLKEIVNRFGTGDGMLLYDSQPSPCKTFVCAREHNGETMSVRKLRSYTRHRDTESQCTVVEAIRATMAHSMFFKPVSIPRGNTNVSFVDAGNDHYNPVFDLFEEVSLLYPSRHIAYYLSIGSGTAATVGDNPSRWFANRSRLPPPLLNKLRHLADRCEDIASAFEREHGNLEGKYFRLSPSLSVYDGKIRWEEEEALDEIVTPYIAAIQNQIQILELLMIDERESITARSFRTYESQLRRWP